MYSQFLEMHKEHLRVVLQLLKCNKLYAKAFECAFGIEKVDYLSHVISAKGIAIDPEKIKAMIKWPTPKNLKSLRGFLGLTGYYKRSIRGYGTIGRPLTKLLKKDNFL